MFKNAFKKLGTQITVITIAAIVVFVAAMLAITITQFSSYNKGILQTRSQSGMSVLEDEVNFETDTVLKDYILLSKDTEHMVGNAVTNVDEFASIYNEQFASRKELFVVLADADGNVVFQSPNYPFSSFDYSSVAKGNPLHGIVKAEGEIVGLHAATAPIGNTTCVIAVGFLISGTDWLDDVKDRVGCDVTIFNDNVRYSTTVINAQGQRAIGTTMDSGIAKTVLQNKQEYHGEAQVVGKHYYVTYIPLYDYTGAVVGALFSGSNAAEADKEFSTVTWIAIIIGIVGAVCIALYLIIFTRRRVSEPLHHAEQYAQEMLAGQLNSTNVNYPFRDDEIGAFVGTLQQAKDGMSRVVGDASRVLSAMAGGDFTQAPNVNYPGVFEEIRASIGKIESELGYTLSSMSASSDEVLTGSTQMAEGSQSLANGTTTQASAIEEISATIQDVSTQISTTAENAAQAGQLSEQTQDKVNCQDSEIQSMVSAMNEISETSKEIEKIIKTIEDISFQTNILALNAAVEAARAGSAGKGFAVVADEVRNLANKSAEAAKSTSTLISAAIAAVDKGAKIADATADSMKEVKDMSAQTARLIVDIASASQEQSESIKQITAGVDQISQVIQTNSATAEETAALCSALSGQSKMLKDQVSRFKTRQ